MLNKNPTTCTSNFILAAISVNLSSFNRNLVQTLEGHSDVVLCVDCHPEQNIIASGSLDSENNIKLWKMR
ncbi:hypothetical protein AVEN_183304-1 [Araneus ventricosus]|uniref:Uncharacterized protein n=1 Tax=Araneus ventricosus TaxID=182803 RepID=A0A4Y2EV67_ARAVE|nr:hypothetical protein AVEN_183304-1 [Araneus ventricosus]